MVYTSLDHAIPFQPQSASDYWLVNFRFLPVSVKLANSLSKERFQAMRESYRELVTEGVAAFRQAPTVMPHFTLKDSAAARSARTLLKPINCCPSLHTASPVFLYNLGAAYFPEMEPILRRYLMDIISVIIKAKFHAVIDIAFGILLARRIIENRLGLEFRSMDTFFTHEQERQDGIPYQLIFTMYREIAVLEASMGGQSASLPLVMERYFQQTGLPRVRRKASACYYDLDKKTLVYPPELRVGKGLI